MADPIVKWPGGKRQLLDKLVARCPEEYNKYHEPFFGGGALFFKLEPESGTVNDANVRLINMYKQVRDNVDEVIELLSTYNHPTDDPVSSREFSDTTRSGDDIENFYYQQRELFNCRPNGEKYDEVEEAALLLYLNRTCYNGVYRENSDGEFNTPIGGYDHPQWLQETALVEASDVLRNVEIQCGDYSYIADAGGSDDLVYFDPPYSQRSGHDYTGSAWSQDDQEHLISIMQEISEKGARVILSNSGDMVNRYFDAGFHVSETKADRYINQDGDGRNQSFSEVIATSFPPKEWRDGRQAELTDF